MSELAYKLTGRLKYKHKNQYVILISANVKVDFGTLFGTVLIASLKHLNLQLLVSNTG